MTAAITRLAGLLVKDRWAGLGLVDVRQDLTGRSASVISAVVHEGRDGFVATSATYQALRGGL
ncbi:MAG: hypothetical protein J2P17_27125 [Mycobacterium sp.]|nr:hypothetical protein [Mycobacterium sp.]